MILHKTVYYEDGSSLYLAFEKPSGAHPGSILALKACLTEAEKAGKKVERICDSTMFKGRILDMNVVYRDEIDLA